MRRALQFAFEITDATAMAFRTRCLALVAALFCLGGCLMPRRGTPVFVDFRAGDFWSGKGLLTEVSEDRRKCHVAVRDRALIVRRLWVDCRRVHARRTR